MRWFGLDAPRASPNKRLTGSRGEHDVTATLDPVPAPSAPATIDVDRERGLILTWADGTTSRFGLEELRQHCPCADCRNRRDRGLPVWPLPSSPQPLRLVDAEMVGAWGISVTWNDGHSTGIYSWTLLRPDEGTEPSNLRLARVGACSVRSASGVSVRS